MIIAKYFTEKLKQLNLEIKKDIAYFLKIINKVKSNKTRHVEVKKKPNNHTISDATLIALINDLLEEVKQILLKRLTDRYSILNREECCSFKVLTNDIVR